MPKIISSDIKKLKKKYHDISRYPKVTDGYENKFKKEYHTTLDTTLIELTKKMITFKNK